MKFLSKLPLLALLIILITGFLFRITGILDNHSFWSDEAFVASLSRNVLTGEKSLIEAIRLLDYQPLYIPLTSLSMKLFGLNEFGARIPIVFFGWLGIIPAYLLAKKLSDTAGGILAAFLYAFSQLNLAHHTQAKPNAILQCILLTNLYLLSLLEKKRSNLLLHLLIIFLASLSTMFHFLGVLTWIPYLIFMIPSLKKLQSLERKKVVFLVGGLIIFLSIFLMASGFKKIAEFLKPGGLKILFNTNNITYLRELLWRNYAFMTLPAVFGILLTFRKHRLFTVSVIVWMLVLLYLWTFRGFRNIRYLMPLFGVIFVYFSVFWSEVGRKILERKSWVACALVILMLFAGGYKIVRKPASFYSPNADLQADIQIADYQTFYRKLREAFPDLDERVVFNNIYDSQSWYLPEKPVTAYFFIWVKTPYPHKADGAMVYGSVEDFKREMAKYPKGIVIIEDWHSLFPEEVKQYVKTHLKRVVRVEGLPQAAGDNWPLEAYGWTLNDTYEK